MSDNPKCPHCKKNAPDSTGMHRSANGGIIRCWNASDEPPAPRISEEEIQAVTQKIVADYVTASPRESWSFKHYEAEVAAILRTLNEEKKA